MNTRPKGMWFCMAFLFWPALMQATEANPSKTSITLMQAIQKSQETFAKAKILKADRDAQLEKVRGSWADLGPRVKLDYTESHFEKELATSQGGQAIISRPEVLKMGSMTVVQPITGLGALGKKALFEEAQLDIKDDTFTLSKAEGAFLASELWLTTYQLEELVRIAENSVKAAEKQLLDAAAMERVGRINRGDVLKLELAVSEAKMRLTQTLNARSTAMANFADILGLDPQTQISLEGVPPDFSNKALSLKEALDLAKSGRLDTKISRKRVELAEFGKSLAYSQFSPQVNLFVKADRNFGDPYIAQPGKITRSYGVNVTWDIWNNGSHVFALREAADQIVKAEEAAKADEDRVLIDVQNSLNSFEASKTSLNQALIAVRQAEEAYRIELIRFKTGSRSATDLVLAESANAQAKGRLITARVDLATNYFKLQKSLGFEKPKY